MLRAEAICKRVNDRLTATVPHPGESNAGLARNALKHAVLELRASSELSKLVLPRSLARDWRQILAYRQQLAAALVTLSRDRTLNDTRHIGTLGASKKQIHVKLAEIAKHDGFRECARVGAAS